MTRDERTAFFGLVEQYVPTLAHDVNPAGLDDDRMFIMVGEALAQQDARIMDLLGKLDALVDAQSGPRQVGVDEVPPEQVSALLRQHGVIVDDVHVEHYTDEKKRARTRNKVVPRKALVDDALSWRDDGDALVVVLFDGKRHRLPYATEPVADEAA